MIKFVALNVRHDKIQSEIVLKHVIHTHQEGVIARKHDILFENMAFYTQIVFQDYVLSN